MTCTSKDHRLIDPSSDVSRLTQKRYRLLRMHHSIWRGRVVACVVAIPLRILVSQGCLLRWADFPHLPLQVTTGGQRAYRKKRKVVKNKKVCIHCT